MLTQEQEEYLAAFADKGLAEQQDIADRNTQIVLDAEVQKARDKKQAELEAEAQTLIDKGMQEFEVSVAPTIRVK